MRQYGITIKIVLILASIWAWAGVSEAVTKPNDQAPLFMLSDVTGKEYKLADFVGSSAHNNLKGVMLSFFASWCGPCRQELSLIRSMQAALTEKNMAVILVNVKDSPGTIKALLAEFHLDNVTVLSDREGKAAEQYQVLFLPTTFFLGADGTVKYVRFGELSEQDIRAGVDKTIR